MATTTRVRGLRRVRPTVPLPGPRAWLGLAAAACVSCAVLSFGVGRFGADHFDVDAWHRADRAERMVHDTLDALAACRFDAVARMGGTTLHDHPSADRAELRIDLDVTPKRDDLLQIRATVRDARTAEELSRFVTWRQRS